MNSETMTGVRTTTFGYGVMLLAIAAHVASGQDTLPRPDTSCRDYVQKFRAGAHSPDSLQYRMDLVNCANQVDSASRARRLNQLEATSLRLGRMFFDIPEFHDEGRLPEIRETPGAPLGPLAGIYASPFLGQFTRPAQIYEQGLPGTLAGMVVVDAPSGTTMPVSYSNLHLEPGVNCIWLYVDPPGPGVPPGGRYKLTYRVRISHPATGAPCDRNATMSAELPVVAVHHNKYGAHSDYPSVARFDTNVHGVPVLGLKCLDAFCEIGVNREADVRTPDNLSRPNPNDVQWGTGPGGQRGRRMAVKAWHDEQAWAERDVNYIWRASPVRPIIIPNPDVADYDSAHFHDHWQTVATIVLRKDPPPGNKFAGWGLRSGENRLQYRYNPTASKWEAQLIQPNGAVVPWNYMYREVHHDMAVPPTVRFRWTVDDDGAWAPCGNACCKSAKLY